MTFFLNLSRLVQFGLAIASAATLILIVLKVADLITASQHVRALLGLGSSVESLDNAPAVLGRGPMSKSMALYERVFGDARRARWLPQFSVDQHLSSVRGSVGALVLPLKAIAGVMILCGLLFTLLQLQAAVGNLGKAFGSLATAQEIQPTDTTPQATAAVDDQQQQVIKNTMSQVAGAAGSAFRVSLVFISIAALLLLASIVIQFFAAKLVQQYSTWAYAAYNWAIPLQMPVSQTDAAARLAESLKALDKLVVAFDTVATKLTALDHFSSTMDESRKAIVEAMAKLPDHIRASVSSLSTEMVAGLSRNMEESTLATKQILAIYGEQEFRMKEIAEHVSAVKGFTEKNSVAFEPLKQLPSQISALVASLQQNEKIAARIDTAVSRLTKHVEDLPISELRSALENLLKAEGDLTGVARTLEAAAELVKKSNSEVSGQLGAIVSLLNQLNSAVASGAKNSLEESRAIKDQIRQLAARLLADNFNGSDMLGKIRDDIAKKSRWRIGSLFNTAGAGE